MGLTKYVLVVLAGVAISGIVVWQLPTVAPTPFPPAPVAADTNRPAVPIDKVKKDVEPAPVSTDAPKVVRKPAPSVRREPPADVRREVAEVSRTVAEARPRAEAKPEAAAPAPPPAVASSAMTFETLNEALDHGGKATFSIIHDHTSGNFDSRDTKATCVGELTIQGNEVRFESAGPDHFTANWADVRDSGANRFFGSGIGGFHVTINDGGKYKNFNLAPQSKDKAEGKLILDLLRARARRQERSK